jgi:malate/lactate dehydrogenase
LPEQFHAMMRLDQNRALTLLARQSFRPITAVKRMAIWGNHSSTQVPDFYNAKIDNLSVLDVIRDEAWLKGEFFSKVQNRGAEIIKVRGKSSAASAASSALDSMKAHLVETNASDWSSAGIYSRGNPYGIDSDLVFSFPCTSQGKGDRAIVGGVMWNDFLEEKIRASEKELIAERDLVRAYLK